jgi:predicted O-linked N-acetylglucosamine transferase (SPINDLY family)
VLSVQPNHPDGLHQLGLIAADQQQFQWAINLITSAISLASDKPAYHSDLGNLLYQMGDIDGAIQSLQKATALDGDFAEAHYNLAIAWKSKGDLHKAIACNERAVALRPDFAEAHNNLGLAWKHQGRLDRAIECYRAALAARPDYAEALSNLGVALRDSGRVEEAIASYERALKFRPDSAEVYNNLGVALRDQGQLDRAIACFEKAIARQPRLKGAHNNLGGAYKVIGRIDKSLACFREEIRLQPNFVGAYDNLLYTMLYDPACDARAYIDECRRWSRQYAEPLRRLVAPHTNDRDPDRRLRIGYVSADFFDHASAFFLLPLFTHHDREQVDLFCYAQVANPDEYTRQMRERVPQWRTTVGISDAEVAAMIRRDQIDILVDLKLHTADNRLLVFAHQPAPVQVTWLGYPGTTGLDAIDYRLTDPYLDPVDGDDTLYTERSIRLPRTFWCYHPLTQDIEINEPPCLRNGYITFGCLNNFCKVNDAVIALWARVLAAVPDSQLLMMAPEGSARQGIVKRLIRDSISADRVEFVPKQSRIEYLQTYRRIDIALDTFPYNGHTTSLDAMWMGVPVVTLVGKTAVGRAGLSQLSNLNLVELIAHTAEQYVKAAADCAADGRRLAELRSTLRQRMDRSPLMDARGFARDLESVYRDIWRMWCHGRLQSEHFS